MYCTLQLYAIDLCHIMLGTTLKTGACTFYSTTDAKCSNMKSASAGGVRQICTCLLNDTIFKRSIDWNQSAGANVL